MRSRLPVQIVSEEMYNKIFGRSKKPDEEVVEDANRQEAKKVPSERVEWMSAKEFFGDAD
jgi:hypothetical protein